MSQQNIPKVKTERFGSKKQKLFVTDSKGKRRKVTEETYLDREIEIRHLIKIAPMYFYCPDNHKIIMVPFSVQMSPEQYLQQTAQQAVNLESVVNQGIQFMESIKPKDQDKEANDQEPA